MPLYGPSLSNHLLSLFNSLDYFHILLSDRTVWRHHLVNRLKWAKSVLFLVTYCRPPNSTFIFICFIARLVIPSYRLLLYNLIRWLGRPGHRIVGTVARLPLRRLITKSTLCYTLCLVRRYRHYLRCHYVEDKGLSHLSAQLSPLYVNSTSPRTLFAVVDEVKCIGVRCCASLVLITSC